MLIGQVDKQTSGAPQRAFRFDAFVLELDRGALLHQGKSIPLRPKCYEVLEYLVLHAGTLVRKSELLDAVWPDVVVTDDSLVQCMMEIRRALGDDSRKLIRTLPRRGYLLDVDVEPYEQPARKTAAGDRRRLFNGRRPASWSAAAVGMLAVALGFTWWGINTARPLTSPVAEAFEPDPEPMAVVPLLDQAPDSGHDGSADSLAHRSFTQGKLFYGRRAEGDLQRALEKFQAAAELAPEWADPLAAMASTVYLMSAHGEISPAEAGPWSADLLEKALSLDPNQPEALIRQACYLQENGNFPEARALHERALIYGRNHALVQSMAAGVARNRGDLDQAISLMRWTVQLDPLSAAHHHNLAVYLLENRQFDAARQEFGLVLELNPQLKDSVHREYMLIAILQGDIQQAMRWKDQLPSGPSRYHGEAMIEFSNGNPAASQAAVDRLMGATDGWKTSLLLAEVFGYRGQDGVAIEWLHRAAEQLISQKGMPGFKQNLVNLMRSPFLEDVLFDSRSADLHGLVAANIGHDKYFDRD